MADITKIASILQHSLGLDQFARGPGYRNHFVTGEWSIDYPVCMQAVSEGLMSRRQGNALSGGDDVFIVTEAGKAWVIQNSPQPPKLTRSQRRYQRYLDSDSSMSFGEWLRTRWTKEERSLTPYYSAAAYDGIDMEIPF